MLKNISKKQSCSFYMLDNHKVGCACQEYSERAIDFSLEGIGALVISHCHIDHEGRIPYLVALGFKGPNYDIQATAHL